MAIGNWPKLGALDISGLNISPGVLKEPLRVDREGGRAKIPTIQEYFNRFGKRLPKELWEELNALEKRLRGNQVA